MAKLLIVEDEPDIARYISDVARGAGHASLVADSAVKALSLLRTEPGIEALIVDHHLGDDVAENGIALLTHLRQSPPHHKLPAIVCTADATPETIGGFLALNIFAFLRKPFRPERLLAELNRLFAGTTAAAPLPPPSAPVLSRVVRGE